MKRHRDSRRSGVKAAGSEVYSLALIEIRKYVNSRPRRAPRPLGASSRLGEGEISYHRLKTGITATALITTTERSSR